jgi:hypothetical protein
MKILWKCVSSGIRHDLIELIMLDRYALPALVSSGFQHEPAASRFHALAKPMCFRAMTVVRLVCPLRHSSRSLENFKSSTEGSQKAVGFIVENAKWKCYPFAALTTIQIGFSTPVEIFVEISPLRTWLRNGHLATSSRYSCKENQSAEL